MKTILQLVLLLLVLNCSKKRTVLLPEIPSAQINKVLDVSPAYIFYDESQPDTSLLNRKNLISTTNWLINVDKRLRLKQVIPHIKILMDKKRNAKMHKNENAKNYYTCNDISSNNLGFIDFTKVNYLANNPDYVEFSSKHTGNYVIVKVSANRTIKLIRIDRDFRTEIPEEFSLSNLQFLDNYLKSNSIKSILLFLDLNLSFQDYIRIKHFTDSTINGKIEVSENEYLFP